MKKIALIADSELPLCSGIGRYQAGLLSHLPAAAPEIEFTVVTSSPLQPFDGVSSSVIDFRLPGSRSMGWAARAASVLSRKGFDAVHLLFHAPYRTPGAEPVIVSVQDINPLVKGRKHPAWRKRLYRRYFPGLISRADLVIVPSGVTAEEILRYMNEPGLEDRIRVVPLGGDSFAGDSAPSARQSDPARTGSAVPDTPSGKERREAPFLLSVNPLAPWKRPERLVNLMQALNAAGLDHELLVTHGGNAARAAAFRARAAAAGLSKRIRIESAPDDATLAGWYGSAEALVALAPHEGFCLPAVEAMHRGCPVVYFRTGALPEVVGEAGISADPGDYYTLAGGIARLTRDSAAGEERSRLSREQASLFTWRRTARKTSELYMELLK